MTEQINTQINQIALHMEIYDSVIRIHVFFFYKKPVYKKLEAAAP